MEFFIPASPRHDGRDRDRYGKNEHHNLAIQQQFCAANFRTIKVSLLLGDVIRCVVRVLQVCGDYQPSQREWIRLERSLCITNSVGTDTYQRHPDQSRNSRVQQIEGRYAAQTEGSDSRRCRRLRVIHSHNFPEQSSIFNSVEIHKSPTEFIRLAAGSIPHSYLLRIAMNRGGNRIHRAGWNQPRNNGMNCMPVIAQD